MMQVKECYLGDGLYARYDGFSIWLRAPRETGDHIVCLEPQVWRALLSFVRDTNENMPRPMYDLTSEATDK